MADEFSTPIQKLQGISTREETGQGEPMSYEDILRQQSQPDPPSMPQQPTNQMQQMQMAPSQMPQMQMQPMQHLQNMQTAMPHMANAPHAPHGGYAHSEYDDDEYERPMRSRRETRDDVPATPNGSWFMTKLKRHKNDIIFALAMFATLTVVIPRLRKMPRFNEGIPMVVMAVVSVIMGCLTNTVSMSV